jgi:hypothetical protein
MARQVGSLLTCGVSRGVLAMPTARVVMSKVFCVHTGNVDELTDIQ